MIDVDEELDRQREALIGAGVPELLGLPQRTLEAGVEALAPAVRAHARGGGSAPGDGVPFALVVSGGDARDMAAAEQLVPLLHLETGSAPGVLDRNHGVEGLRPYRPIESVGPPPASVYALVGIERGDRYRGVAPEEALPQIRGRGRTPLTILEGIVLVLLHPSILQRNACFMLSGSRRGDRRVPALWISGRAPKLGWCWDGNPHDWLGVASAAERIAPS
jgi:hypothetical protein